MTYLAKDDPRVLLAQYKNGDDSESDVLEDLVDWIENDWDSGLIHDGETEEHDKLTKTIIEAINQYGWRNDKTMKVIAKAEQQQLKDWTNSVKGE